MNALVEILGKQFKVEKGDKLKIPYINKKIGEKLTFNSILYSDDGKNTKLGKPYLKDLQMEAKLLEHGKENKIIVFKFKRRKGYQKKNGHKQKFSLIEISSFKKKSAKKAPAKKVAAKKAPAKKVAAKKTPKKEDK